MDADLFDSWFRLADRDRDGRVSGGEAVDFFQRANLNQDTLFKVWSLVAGDNAFLTKPQFYSALRLISLAQRSGGSLPEAAARSTLIGVGPPLPPPALNGLEQPQPQQWSGANQVMQGQPSAATAQQQQQQQGAAPSFPSMQQAQAQHYGSMFSQMDKDRDGYVQGGDCFNAFMQWGLPKPTLKDIWQVVAANEGRLNQHQFVQCLYLMDQAKRGQAPPAKLGAGPFPPMAQAAPQPPQQPPTGAPAGPAGFSIAAQQRAEYDVFSHDLPLPDMPPKRSWQAPAPQPSAPSSVPTPGPAVLSEQPPAQRQRLETDNSQSQQAEQELIKAQTEVQASRAREAAYQSALQELTLFKSRTAAALLQAQERAAQATAQADAMQQQYEGAWAGAEDSHRTGRRLLDSLTKAKGRKAEMTTKLEELERDIAQLGQHSEEQVANEESAAERLSEEVAGAEARKAGLELRVTVVSEERKKLEAQLASLQGGVSQSEAELLQAQEAIATIKDQLEAGDQAAATSNLQSLLKRSAQLYTSLTELASAAAVDVPEEAQLSAGNAKADDEPPGPRILQWSDFVAAGAADWEDFEDEGFTVVDALPNEERYDPSPVSSRSRMSPSPSPHERVSSMTQRDQSSLPQPSELAFADTAKSADLNASGPKTAGMIPTGHSSSSRSGTPKAQPAPAAAGSMDFPPPSPVATEPAGSMVSTGDNWAAF